MSIKLYSVLFVLLKTQIILLSPEAFLPFLSESPEEVLWAILVSTDWYTWFGIDKNKLRLVITGFLIMFFLEPELSLHYQKKSGVIDRQIESVATNLLTHGAATLLLYLNMPVCTGGGGGGGALDRRGPAKQ
ncbi:hypothetical protein ACJX0J_032858 [Zea mays]